ncbi:hypothetical protein VOI54_03595 [Tamlana sp. 2201CG12-4]|uniref:hypothetical protein n=1 Tax=Tamlana sp. 2201CG12-4 TaxID=3112582 RepID=UPI002DB589A6|nr:hypothetical protein [Tamlana sp. 2201CG12-4]MEC3906086.1 hypothetical protein [Tamlana sp. 2201CG12-4]
MKKIILFTLVLMSSYVFAQEANESSKEEKFTYTEKGLSPRSIAVNLKGMTKTDLINKARAWRIEKFTEPKNKAKEDDHDDDYDDETGKNNSKKINLRGNVNNAICLNEDSKRTCENAFISIDVIIEDGTYTFKPKDLLFRTTYGKKKAKVKLNFDKTELYSDNREIKAGHELVPSQLEDLFNSLHKSLYNYITDQEQEDEW